VIDIVLVNWNSGGQLEEALASIVNCHKGLIGRVVVVDNASSDGSMARIKENKFELPLELILNKTNFGFGAACNQGASLCDAEYILFLNPDTRLFEKSISFPLAYMEKEKNSNVGIVGIQLIDSSGRVARSCSRFPAVSLTLAQALGLNKLPWLKAWGQHMNEWGHDCDRAVDQVIGAFFLIRRSLFADLEGFDERFFVYFEEVDVSYRAKQLGWRSVYLAGAQAFHAGGGTSEQIKAVRLFYSLRSRLLYGFKHFSPLRAWVLVVTTLLVEPVSRAMFSFLRGGLGGLENTFRGYAMLWRNFPVIFKNSRK
jgi:GT2 family glycosyltransferase